MCFCKDVCYYYKILIRHNTELKKMLCKYIDVVEMYICTLSGVQKENIKIIDPCLIQPPSELLEVIHGLLSNHNNDDNCDNGNNENRDCYNDDTDSIGDNERNKYSVFILLVQECNDGCNKQCKNQCRYSFKRKNIAHIAKYCDKYGNVVQLCNDISTHINDSNISDQINKYIGFKQFLQDLIEIL